jgi:hypothetical protein
MTWREWNLSLAQRGEAPSSFRALMYDFPHHGQILGIERSRRVAGKTKTATKPETRRLPPRGADGSAPRGDRAAHRTYRPK